MHTEKTKDSLIVHLSLIGDFLESAMFPVFLCVHRVSVVSPPMPTEWKRLNEIRARMAGEPDDACGCDSHPSARLATTAVRFRERTASHDRSGATAGWWSE
ncbi:hypothetical protein LBMAG56_40980 [Verrucomicrobiota bacterium]|nr:hypothetical protein LBMAG56_40980 [Verrucomicrobiota bacterium]